VALVAAPHGAHADFPALSRELSPEPRALPADTVYDLELQVVRHPGLESRLEAEASINWFARTLEGGSLDPDLGSGEIGGRAQVSVALNRVVLGADITQDGIEDVDSREYPSRFHVTGRFPEIGLSARAIAGMGEHQYAGTDVELEAARLRLLGPAQGTHFSLATFLRGRWLERADHTLWTTAASLVLGPLPGRLSGATAALTVEPDHVLHELPDTFAMVQVVWASGAEPAAEPSLPTHPGATSTFEIARRWYAYANYAFPLDDRQVGRITFGVGLRLGAPIGRGD